MTLEHKNPNEIMGYLKLVGVTQASIARKFGCHANHVNQVIATPHRRRREGSLAAQIVEYVNQKVAEAKRMVKAAA